MEQFENKRKRVANFTVEEKVLLAQLIKRRPIIESKQTDGKSVLKKKAMWELITEEFNSNYTHVHKRDTITLKRAWDNMKAYTRKSRAAERENQNRTEGGAPPAPHQGAVSVTNEAAPVTSSEIVNCFDSDGSILNSIKKGLGDSEASPNSTADVSFEHLDCSNYGDEGKRVSEDIADISDVLEIECYEQDKTIPHNDNNVRHSGYQGHVNIRQRAKTKASAAANSSQQLLRKPVDFIRREAIMRLKKLDEQRRLEMQLIKSKMEIQTIRRRAAEMEEERNIILLEKAKFELEKVKLEFDQLKCSIERNK